VAEVEVDVEIEGKNTDTDGVVEFVVCDEFEGGTVRMGGILFRVPVTLGDNDIGVTEEVRDSEVVVDSVAEGEPEALGKGEHDGVRDPEVVGDSATDTVGVAEGVKEDVVVGERVDDLVVVGV